MDTDALAREFRESLANNVFVKNQQVNNNLYTPVWHSVFSILCIIPPDLVNTYS